MKKLKKWLPSKRKIMQLYFALLFNANLKGFVTGRIFQGSTKNFCAPGINCYSCPGAIGACPLGTLQGAFSSARHTTLYYVGGILLLYSIMFGRMICGWLCPFGLVQEVCYKIKTPKLKKSPVTRLLSYLKYAILVFFVIIVPIMYAFRNKPVPAFCKYICPAGTLEGGIGLLSHKTQVGLFAQLGPLFTWKFLLMISILVGCIFIFRLFCRFLCPLGALYGLFNKFSVFGIKVDNSKCTHCGLCHRECKVDIRHPGDQECISCGDCVNVCPTKAISWSGPKILVAPNEIGNQEPVAKKKRRTATRIVTAVVMAAVLIGAIVYYWRLPGPSTKPPVGQSHSQTPIPQGTTEGTLCYNGNLEIVGKDGVTGETIDPAATGKLTVINFWGTWCGPCVTELPYFDQIAREYEDSVTVVAIHSAMLKETAPEYIAANYPETPMVFAWDHGDGDYYNLVGGTGAYPYTMILDKNGVIQKLYPKPVTYSDLKGAVDSILKAQDAVIPQGNTVNTRCYSDKLEILSKDGVTGETIDPAATGKLTVINFWGTWCGPCVTELPYFDQIAREYSDSVTVVAIHSAMLKETAPEYIAANYPETPMVFAWDHGDGDYYNLVGGTGAYPHTIILDEQGVIQKIFPKSLEYSDLKKAVDEILNSDADS